MIKLTVKIWCICLICFVCMSFSSPIYLQTQNLDLFEKAKKIKLFKTPKEEIDKLFEGAELKEITSKRGYYKEVTYNFDEGRLRVVYSTGKCNEHKKISGYDVDRGIVIGFYLILFNPIKKSDLDIDFSKLKKWKSSEVGSVTYFNEKEGIEIEGDEEKVDFFEFSPSEKQKNQYSCEKMNKK